MEVSLCQQPILSPRPLVLDHRACDLHPHKIVLISYCRMTPTLTLAAAFTHRLSHARPLISTASFIENQFQGNLGASLKSPRFYTQTSAFLLFFARPFGPESTFNDQRRAPCRWPSSWQNLKPSFSPVCGDCLPPSLNIATPVWLLPSLPHMIQIPEAFSPGWRGWPVRIPTVLTVAARPQAGRL